MHAELSALFLTAVCHGIIFFCFLRFLVKRSIFFLFPRNHLSTTVLVFLQYSLTLPTVSANIPFRLFPSGIFAFWK